PVLRGTCWNCQRLRCGSCGHVYTARPPPEARGPTFDETAVVMIALCRYSLGLPHNRLAKMQKHLKLPVPASTQWDLLRDSAPAFQPVFAELVDDPQIPRVFGEVRSCGSISFTDGGRAGSGPRVGRAASVRVGARNS